MPAWLQPGGVESPNTLLGGESGSPPSVPSTRGLLGLEGGYFSSERDARVFYDETCYMLVAQAPSKPVKVYVVRS